jgi:serine/threonine-protein kinase HipA
MSISKSAEKLKGLVVFIFTGRENLSRLPFSMQKNGYPTLIFSQSHHIDRSQGAALVEDCRELFRRMIFNILTSNFDDHLRNHGFLLDPASKKWRLSPAYDMNPVPIYESKREMATWIDENGPEALLGRTLEVAEFFYLDEIQARDIISFIADVTSHWISIGRQHGISKKDLDPYETAFNHEGLADALRLADAHP